MKKIIIAIDGYSGCGKSSTAKEAARALNFTYIDTGAMYRAVALYFCQHYIQLTNPKMVQKALDDIEISFKKNPATFESDTYLNGLNVEEDIRKMEVSDLVSDVSAIPEVRYKLVEQQRKLGKKRGIVMDGRDIGTVVFPDAELKIFMTADKDIRAGRRQLELLEKDQLVDLDQIMENLENRDKLDTERKEGPLRQAEDAIVIDTSHLTLEEQTEIVLHNATQKMMEKDKNLQHHYGM